MGTITALQIQKRDKERVNVFLDGAYAFSVKLTEAARLHKGQTLTDADIAALQTDDAVARAVDRAARFLSYRPRSTAEVRRNLAGKGVDDAVIEAAVQRLDAMGYLDDHAFARFWVENRTAFKPRGQRALQYELHQKGVSRSIIDEVLEDLDPGEAAYRAASARLARLRGLDRQTFRNKLGSFLERRGFSYAVINDTLTRVMDEAEADYFAEDDA